MNGGVKAAGSRNLTTKVLVFFPHVLTLTIGY